MPHVHRMREVIRVAKSIARYALRDLAQRPPLARQRLIEPAREVLRRERGRDRPGAGARFLEVASDDVEEERADSRVESRSNRPKCRACATADED